MSMRRDRVAKGALSTASMTLVSNGTGFLRQLTFAWIYGAGHQMDAFLIASILSQMVFASIDTAISSTLIPVYTALRQKSEAEAETFIASLSGLVGIFSAVAGFLVYLGAPLLTHLLAPGFGPSELKLTSYLLRVMTPSLVFMGLSSISVGILQTKSHFGAPAAQFVPRNIALILLVAWLGHRYGIGVLAWGSLLGAVLQLGLVLRPLRRLKTPMRFLWRPGHHGIRDMGTRLPAVFANMFMYQAALVVDRILASSLPHGMISSLTYAQLLISFPIGLLSSLAIAAFPTFSELAVLNAGPQLAKAVRLSLRILILLVAPITLFVVFLRTPIVTLVYAHGAFSGAAVANTSYAMLFFAIGMMSMALNGIISRVILALGDTRVLFTSAAWGVSITVAADLLFVHPLQQGGLALGTSLGSWASTIVLLRFLAQRLEHFSLGSTLAQAALAGLLALVAFGAGHFALLHLGLNLNADGTFGLIATLCLEFGLGAALYLGLQRLVGPKTRLLGGQVVKALHRESS